AQVEDMWQNLESTYPSIKFQVPKFEIIDKKNKSPFLDFFTDYSFLEEIPKQYNKYREGRKTVELILDLNEIEDFYINLFGVPFSLNIQNIKNGLYTIGVTIPCRIFTRRLGTLQMVDKANGRYFIPKVLPELLPEQEEDICQAVFKQMYNILGDSRLMSPEECLSKRQLSYSWGFPYRMLEAQDTLTYFNGMLINGCQNKKFDPMSGCTIGMSSAHSIPLAIFEQHSRQFVYHNKVLQILINHGCHSIAQEILREMTENLGLSPNINTYRIIIQLAAEKQDTEEIEKIFNEMKKLGYVINQKMAIKAWTQLTGLPADDFFKFNKVIAYGDDNVLNSNVFNDKWYHETICDYFAKKGVNLRLEGKNDSLEGVEFLSKVYSISEKQLDEVKHFVSDYQLITHM
ncbi:6571_t:CDS:2, partial [Gigaspora margarita]